MIPVFIVVGTPGAAKDNGSGSSETQQCSHYTGGWDQTAAAGNWEYGDDGKLFFNPLYVRHF